MKQQKQQKVSQSFFLLAFQNDVILLFDFSCIFFRKIRWEMLEK